MQSDKAAQGRGYLGFGRALCYSFPLNREIFPDSEGIMTVSMAASQALNQDPFYMAEQIKVYIIEDHPVVRKGLREALEDEGIEVVGEAASREEGLAQAFTCRPDVLVVDLTMGQEDGPSILTQLLAINPHARIVVFSMRNKPQTMGAAYQEGAMAYIPKNVDLSFLVEAVRSVASGRVYFMPLQAEQILACQAAEARHGGRWLNPRTVLNASEFSVFLLLAAGQTNEEIAQRMNVSVKTIQNRSSTIRSKLNCTPAQYSLIARDFDLLSTA